MKKIKIKEIIEINGKMYRILLTATSRKPFLNRVYKQVKDV